MVPGSCRLCLRNLCCSFRIYRARAVSRSECKRLREKARILHAGKLSYVEIDAVLSAAGVGLLVLDLFAMDDEELWTRLSAFVGRAPPRDAQGQLLPFPHQRYAADMTGAGADMTWR